MAKIIKQKSVKRSKYSEIVLTSDSILALRGKVFPFVDLIFAIKEKSGIEVLHIEIEDLHKSSFVNFRTDTSYIKFCERILEMREDRSGDRIGSVRISGIYENATIEISFCESTGSATIRIDEPERIEEIKKIIKALNF